MTTAEPENSPWGTANRIPPIGLAFVAANLEKAGYKVTLLDNYLLNKTADELKTYLKNLNPEIVGVSCSSNTYKRAIETAKAVKEALPNCKLVTGGPHPSVMPESMLEYPEVDYVVIGEGERAMQELADHITAGKTDSELANIPGIAYIKNGQMAINPPRFIENLDEVPYPARHLLPMDKYMREAYFLDNNPVDVMNVMRGCPFNCNWCNVKEIWGAKSRSFSPKRVADEMEYIYNTYGTRGVYFVGDNFTLNKNRAIDICKEIQSRNLDMVWACDTGVDLVSRDVLKAMKNAGCQTIWFGVESGSPHILEIINRGITVEQATQAFKLCKEENIQTGISLMLGIPGETRKDMETTFKFARKLDPDYHQFNVFIAYPGCKLYKEIIANKQYDRIEDFLAYVKTDEFNYESLMEIQKQFHVNFNKSPKRILGKIKREGFWNVMQKGIKYAKS
jgi:anaerobic magnesium-protoporphyrin IX monomethyl ester cyclase